MIMTVQHPTQGRVFLSSNQTMPHASPSEGFTVNTQFARPNQPAVRSGLGRLQTVSNSSQIPRTPASTIILGKLLTFK